MAGRGELRDLVADGRTDARDARRVPGPVRRHEVHRAAPDRVGRPVIGDGLEDELALDLQHVADVVEDASEVAVRQVARGAVALHRRRVCGLGHGLDWVSHGSMVARRAGSSSRLRGDHPVAASPLRSIEGAVRGLDERPRSARRVRRRRPRRPTRSRRGPRTVADPGRGPRPGCAPPPPPPRPDPGCATGPRTPRHRTGPGRRPRGPRPTIAPATARSTSSPVAWPWVSLRALNLSISTMRMPTASPARRRRARSETNSSK